MSSTTQSTSKPARGASRGNGGSKTTRPKIYPCPHCGVLFDRPCSVKSHVFTHTNERPHICSRCGTAAFATKSNLYRHIRGCGVPRKTSRKLQPRRVSLPLPAECSRPTQLDSPPAGSQLHLPPDGTGSTSWHGQHEHAPHSDHLMVSDSQVHGQQEPFVQSIDHFADHKPASSPYSPSSSTPSYASSDGGASSSSVSAYDMPLTPRSVELGLTSLLEPKPHPYIYDKQPSHVSSSDQEPYLVDRPGSWNPVVPDILSAGCRVRMGCFPRHSVPSMPMALDCRADHRSAPPAPLHRRPASSLQYAPVYPPAHSQPQQHQPPRFVTPLIAPSPRYHESLYENSYIRRLSVDAIDATVSQSPLYMSESSSQPLGYDQQQQQQYHVAFHPQYVPQNTEDMAIFHSRPIPLVSRFVRSSTVAAHGFVNVPPTSTPAVNPEPAAYFDGHHHHYVAPSWDGSSSINVSNYVNTAPLKFQGSAPPHFAPHEW